MLIESVSLTNNRVLTVWLLSVVDTPSHIDRLLKLETELSCAHLEQLLTLTKLMHTAFLSLDRHVLLVWTSLPATNVRLVKLSTIGRTQMEMRR